jgi:hypothetical protein
VLKGLAQVAAVKKQKQAKKPAPLDPDQDESFAFIAGYISNALPYRCIG